jgi:hypothetical protein
VAVRRRSRGRRRERGCGAVRSRARAGALPGAVCACPPADVRSCVSARRLRGRTAAAGHEDGFGGRVRARLRSRGGHGHARAAGSGDGVRLDYRSGRVGRDPSQLRLFTGSASEPWRTIELPDAVSAVAEAPFGWYVGCRDGFLYGLERSGDLAWRWQTPGAAAFRPEGPARSTFAPRPTGWPRTGTRRWSPGSTASGRSVRTG